MINIAYTLGLLLVYISSSGGFLFNKKTDCLVSEWGKWSEPFGFGTIFRERTILRYPQGGGIACPTDLRQEKTTGKLPTIKRTAKVLADNFVVKTRIVNGRTVGQLRDLLIIVDSSGSIGRSRFNAAKPQLMRLLGMLCPVPDPFKGYQQAALIEYSSRVTEIFDFNDKPNTLAVQQGINSMNYMGSSTCTATAFNYAYNTMFTAAKGMRSRSDVKQEVLIITDGRSNCGGNAIAAAQQLQNKASVFGLMIGTHSTGGMAELTSYVNTPIDQHLFAIDGFQSLKLLVDLVEDQLKQVPCAPFDI